MTDVLILKFLATTFEIDIFFKKLNFQRELFFSFFRKQDSQVFYVLPVESILGKLPVVPVGDAGTIPYSMRQHAADFVDAAFDTREGAGDGVVGT
jgi:hypothetical protein